MNFLNYTRNLLLTTENLITPVRNASKKTSGSTRNPINPHGR